MTYNMCKKDYISDLVSMKEHVVKYWFKQPCLVIKVWSNMWKGEQVKVTVILQWVC